MVFLGETSIGKDRVSEILALVNRMEKTTPPDFSIRVFGYVYVLGSQRNYRTLLSLFNSRGREDAARGILTFMPPRLHWCAVTVMVYAAPA
jgi:hypothetical protein